VSSAKKRIMKYIESITPSTPIFKVSIPDPIEGYSIRVEKDENFKYKAQMDMSEPLAKLVAECYSETFNMRSKKYDVYPDTITSQVITTVITNMVAFIESNMPCKNPKMTKLYKWVYNVKYNCSDEVLDGMLLIYTYMEPLVDPNSFKILEDKKQHTPNIFALLEAMKEKHEARS